MSESETTVVLVHGAFADGSSWAGVVRELQARGVRVRVAANELRGGASDGERLAALVRGIDGPVVLAGHSYGGVVITEAAARAENVTGLVYVTAFALEEGEAPLELLGRFPANELGSALVAQELPGTEGTETWLSLDPAKFHRIFAADVAPEQTRIAAVSQRPINAAAFEEKAGTAAWKTLPSWYLVAAADESIHPEAQRAMAERSASVIVETAASHSVAVSRPDAVAEIIVSAVTATAVAA